MSSEWVEGWLIDWSWECWTKQEIYGAFGIVNLGFHTAPEPGVFLSASLISSFFSRADLILYKYCSIPLELDLAL